MLYSVENYNPLQNKVKYTSTYLRKSMEIHKENNRIVPKHQEQLSSTIDLFFFKFLTPIFKILLMKWITFNKANTF